MGKRYSKEELKQINSFAAEGLTNEEITARLADLRQPSETFDTARAG